jgi:aspartate 1-decarboxylase
MSAGVPRYRSMLKSKIHRARVTHANVDYEGSVSIDPQLLKAADILPGEEVHVWNVTRGTRFCTYAIEGPSGAGEMSVNGAAAHLAKPDDRIIVATFQWIDDQLARSHQPIVIFVDDQNRIKHQGPEVAGPAIRKA